MVLGGFLALSHLSYGKYPQEPCSRGRCGGELRVGELPQLPVQVPGSPLPAQARGRQKICS